MQRAGLAAARDDPHRDARVPAVQHVASAEAACGSRGGRPSRGRSGRGAGPTTGLTWRVALGGLDHERELVVVADAADLHAGLLMRRRATGAIFGVKRATRTDLSPSERSTTAAPAPDEFVATCSASSELAAPVDGVDERGPQHAAVGRGRVAQVVGGVSRSAAVSRPRMLPSRRNSELLTAGPIGTGGDQPAPSRRWTNRVGDGGDRLQHRGEGAGQPGERGLAAAARGVDLLPGGGVVGVAAGREAEGVGDAGVGAGRERLAAVGGDVVERRPRGTGRARCRAGGSARRSGENRPARSVVGPATSATAPLRARDAAPRSPAAIATAGAEGAAAVVASGRGRCGRRRGTCAARSRRPRRARAAARTRASGCSPRRGTGSWSARRSCAASARRCRTGRRRPGASTLTCQPT